MVSFSVVVACCFLGTAFAACPFPAVPGDGTKSDKCLYPSNCNTNITASPDTGYDPTLLWYEVVISPGGDHDASDSICCTSTPAGQNCSWNYRYVKYENGSCNIQRSVVSKISSTPGAFRTAAILGPDGCYTCVYNDYALKKVCDNVIVLHRCYIFGSCFEQYVGREYIVVVAKEPYLSDECYQKALDAGVSAGLTNDQPIRLKNKLGAQCIYKNQNNTVTEGAYIPCDKRVNLD